MSRTSRSARVPEISSNQVICRRDLERRPPNGYESGGAVRAALGRGNPYERFGAGRYGAALLDLMVGEPVAYATGSPELKATGPFRTVSNSPITKSQRGIVCGGVPQTHLIREDYGARV